VKFKTLLHGRGYQPGHYTAPWQIEPKRVLGERWWPVTRGVFRVAPGRGKLVF